MGILTKEVEVMPTGKMIQYYRNKGYDAKYGCLLIVRVEDLSDESCVAVDVLCDYCKETICKPTYRDYRKRVARFGHYACGDCRSIHQKMSCIEKYGVDSPAKSEEVRKRMEQTSLERYNTKNPMQNEAVKEKQRQSVYEKYGAYNVSQSLEIQRKREQIFLERYNATNPFGSKEIQEKALATLMSKYNVESPLQIPEAKEKARQTFINNYGFDNPNKSPYVRLKTAQTLYKNGTIPTSNQQLYIFDVYSQNWKIESNYPISHYNVDICFLEEKLIVEIDFGGHDLQVKTGRLTREEFDQKELVRRNIIKREGYKQMHIISKNDRIPSDQILLQMLQDARQYFLDFPNHSWIEFNIDTSSVRNAENKNGIPYHYGKLRTIKNETTTS